MRSVLDDRGLAPGQQPRRALQPLRRDDRLQSASGHQRGRLHCGQLVLAQRNAERPQRSTRSGVGHIPQEDAQQALTAYLRFPREHWPRIRHSNFIERTFGETRRRTKVIGRLPGETSCVSLVWAVLDRASRVWRGFTVTAAGTRLLHDLRRQLIDPPTPIKEHTNQIHQPAGDAA